MTVFKGYMLMFRRNMGSAIMYFVIFLSIAVLISAVMQRESTNDFAAKELDVIIVDLDKSELSQNVTTYLQKKHNVTIAEDDKSALYEKLYYGAVRVVLRIQDGFEEAAFRGESGICLTNAPGSHSGIYLEQQINFYISNVLSYCEAGYSTGEACKQVLQHEESTVTIEDVNGNGGVAPNYAGFFQYIPYLFISVYCSVLARTLFTFRRKNVKNRAMASAVSLFRQNGEAILAFMVIGVGIYLVTLLFAAGLYQKELLEAANLNWYLVNAFLNMLVSLAIAFLIGLFVKNAMQVNTITTPVSLTLSFLCGVFVPLEMLGIQIKNIAKFLPVYWYEVVNTLLVEHGDIRGEIRTQVLAGMGIQLLFVFALTGIGVAAAKYQQQEK